MKYADYWVPRSVFHALKKIKKNYGFRLKIALKRLIYFIVINSSNLFGKFLIMNQIKFNRLADDALKQIVIIL